MFDMLDGVIDILEMICVLALVVAVGFGFIVPLVKSTNMHYDNNIQDKAMLLDVEDYNSKIEKGYASSVVTYTPREVALLTQIQDVCMPLPRKFNIGDTDFEVNGAYVIERATFGIAMWNKIPNKEENIEYIVKYSYKQPNGVDNDAFILEEYHRE